MIGSSGANVKESHGSSGSVYIRAFTRLAKVIKQLIINCPNDGNVASMPELCHRHLLLLEGRDEAGGGGDPICTTALAGWSKMECFNFYG